MIVNLVTIKRSGDSGYAVAHISFPEIQGKNVPLSVSENLSELYVDKRTAEVAAKEFAKMQNFSYVPENARVITSIFFGEIKYLAILTLTEGAIAHCLGVDGFRSVAQATHIAQSRGLSLLLPQ